MYKLKKITTAMNGGRRVWSQKSKDVEGYSPQHNLNSEKNQKQCKCFTTGKWSDKL